MAFSPDSPPSPPSSDLSEPPSIDSDAEDNVSTAVPSPRPSVDIAHTTAEHLQPPSKKRKTGRSSLATFDRAPSSQAPDQDDDNVSISSDGWSDAPGSPSHGEWALREEAQTQCLWRDCPFGSAVNNDELVKHVQSTHCATGGPKKTKYVCEWGECQRKTSNHPSGYALKAHMRSHTKEKPYYCALPECDKAFTRSDALAKHMRTVHEPEQPRSTTTTTSNAADPTPPGKKSVKLKLTNGVSSTAGSKAGGAPPTPTDTTASPGPTHDEDGNEIAPSPPTDNITYIPAHHPITGQPGFMIHYPPDIHFTAWESSIAADDLMRLLRRQLHWASKEQEALRRECEDLELKRHEEWRMKEILVEGVMESEWARGVQEDLLRDVDERVRVAMEVDVHPSKRLGWTPSTPSWRRERPPPEAYRTNHHGAYDTNMPDRRPETPGGEQGQSQRTPSPPPTGHSAGFDGDGQPYDNYLADRMAEMQRLKAERQRHRSVQGTPQKLQRAEDEAEAEADAAGALMGMSGGSA